MAKFRATVLLVGALLLTGNKRQVMAVILPLPIPSTHFPKYQYDHVCCMTVVNILDACQKVACICMVGCQTGLWDKYQVSCRIFVGGGTDESNLKTCMERA